MKNIESLYAAYIAIWGIFLVYQFTVSRRVARLSEEIERLKQQISSRT